MKPRRVLKAMASAILAGGVLCVGVPPAVAGPPLPTASAAIGVSYPSSTTFRVCPFGFTNDGGLGEWVFEADGLRADGTQIHIEQATFGAAFSACYYISTNGTTAGFFFATLAFGRLAPIDTNSAEATTVPELTTLAGDEEEWTPQQNGAGFGM